MIGISNSIFKANVKAGGGAPAYDADAQAYFTANTAITSSADKNAINDFYLGLKSDGIYTKIKAMYLPIWGSAASSKWNLVNPADTDAAFRLTFATGMTFTSSGMAGNGTTGYADTNFNPSISSTLNNTHYSFYSRTNNDTTSIDMGYANISGTQWILSLRYTGVGTISDQYNGTTGRVSTSQTNSQGFFIGSRTTSAIHKAFKNGLQIGSTNTGASGSFLSLKVALLGQNRNGTVTNYSTKQCSFASIGDGLTDTEATNFSNRVNTLLAYFGINTYPVVSDADAQAYINANEAITSQSDANAINTFFTGLKSDGVYSKIKAMYLPIWGSASSCKWNLVNPLDTNAAFRLTFATGMTFTSSGMTSNGTSGYANTYYNPNTNGLLNSAHLSFYSRTDNNLSQAEIGAGAGADYHLLQLRVSNLFYSLINQSGLTSVSNTNSLGFHLGNRQLSNDTDIWKNGTKLLNGTTASTLNLNRELFICCYSNAGVPSSYSTKQCAFSSIGNGLTDTEVTNFYNRVQTLMTYFGINV